MGCVITCCFGDSDWSNNCWDKQDFLLSLPDIIDNPLRATKKNKYVKRGDIILRRKDKSIGGGGKFISLCSEDSYLGKCETCPDQCGINFNTVNELKNETKEMQKK